MSHHPPAQQRSIINTLFHRAERVSHKENIQKEKEHVVNVSKHKGYTSAFIDRTTRKKSTENIVLTKNEFKAIVPLPYIRGISERIGKILSKPDIRTVYLPKNKIRDLLPNAKNCRTMFQHSGVYKIPVECRAVYIGETSRTLEKRLDEHKRYIRLMQPNKSAVSEHHWEQGHRINFEKTCILAKS